MKLKINRASLITMMEFEAKHDVRYFLNGMCFRPDGKVAATDGHTLAISKHDNEITAPVIVKVHKLPTRRFHHAEIDTESKIATLMTEEGLRVGLAMCDVIDGTYPDVDKVIPKTVEAVEKIQFNAGYLARIEKCAKLINPKFQGVTMTFDSPIRAAKFEICGIDDEITIIIMPMRF